MKFIIALVVMGFGYYTLTYGISLWRNKNKLGGIGIGLLVGVGTIGPIMMLFIR